MILAIVREASHVQADLTTRVLVRHELSKVLRRSCELLSSWNCEHTHLLGESLRSKSNPVAHTHHLNLSNRHLAHPKLGQPVEVLGSTSE